MATYIARAPITVGLSDQRPGDTFDAEPADVAALAEAGAIEPVVVAVVDEPAAPAKGKR